MKNEYVWVEISPGRHRQYLVSDLKARPKKYGEAPVVFSDEMDATPGPDGEVYESRSAYNKAAERENCYVYNKKELDEHIRSAKADKKKKQAVFDNKVKEKTIEITNDFDLSNKL